MPLLWARAFGPITFALPETNEDTTPPAAPTLLVAEGQTGGIALSWAQNAESDLVGYHVHRSAISGSGFNKITASPVVDASFLDVNAPAGVRRYYYVTAVDNNGNESGQSNEVSAERTVSADTTPPAVPSGLNAIGIDTGVSLTWVANTEPDLGGYYLYRSNTSSGTYSQLNSAVITGTSYNDTSAARGTTYFYKIAAVDTPAGNSSALSGSVSGTRPNASVVTATTSVINGAGYQNSGTQVPGTTTILSHGDVSGPHRADDKFADVRWRPRTIGDTGQVTNNGGAMEYSRVTTDRIYRLAGRTTGGFFVSTNRGKSWSKKSDVHSNGATRGTGNLRDIGRMIALGEPYVYVAGEGDFDAGGNAVGIFRSTDDGETLTGWALKGVQVRAMSVDPNNVNFLYVGSDAGSGSSDGGLYQITTARSTGAPAASAIKKITGPGGTHLTSHNYCRDVTTLKRGSTTLVYFWSGIQSGSGTSASPYTTSSMGLYSWDPSKTAAPVLLSGGTGGLSTTSQWTWVDVVSVTGAGTSASPWAIDAAGTSGAIHIIVGCWQPERLDGQYQKAVVIAASIDNGANWQKTIGQGSNYSKFMPDGQEWWLLRIRSAFNPGGGDYDASKVEFDRDNPAYIWLWGRAGVWRGERTSTTWLFKPAMRGLGAAMSHVTIPDYNDQSLWHHGDVDWGYVRLGDRGDAVHEGDTPAGGENCFSLHSGARGLLAGFGSRGDNAAMDGYLYMKPNSAADGGWTDLKVKESLYPVGTSKADVGRVLGVADGLNSSNQRVIIAIVQNHGIYRWVNGSWNTTALSTIAHKGSGVKNTLENQVYWYEGKSHVYSFDRQTGIWRIANNGMGNIERISTITSTKAWTGFLCVGSTGTTKDWDMDVLFFTTATDLYVIKNATAAASSVTATKMTLPAGCTKPSAVAVHRPTGTLFLSQRNEGIEPGLWSTSDPYSTTSPTWVSRSNDDYLGGVRLPMGFTVTDDGWLICDTWGNSSHKFKFDFLTP